jgi:hypothetical protein
LDYKKQLSDPFKKTEKLVPVKPPLAIQSLGEARPPEIGKGSREIHKRGRKKEIGPDFVP